ncbi:MAG: hypothetical protein ACD_71C00169G0002 [uncultured bacterium (gcode 4)]|uniref:Uncharacterized protein n=1 Tax=uncultured bacterium (gcode 4) TaxID=1234023 RepID=K1YN09_9BACT|nr:MAG: hypothetical protein ACD_71C00169G0002 [uncultured bacterium (gcode 4)]
MVWDITSAQKALLCADILMNNPKSEKEARLAWKIYDELYSHGYDEIIDYWKEYVFNDYLSRVSFASAIRNYLQFFRASGNTLGIQRALESVRGLIRGGDFDPNDMSGDGNYHFGCIYETYDLWMQMFNKEDVESALLFINKLMMYISPKKDASFKTRDFTRILTKLASVKNKNCIKWIRKCALKIDHYSVVDVLVELILSWDAKSIPYLEKCIKKYSSEISNFNRVWICIALANLGIYLDIWELIDFKESMEEWRVYGNHAYTVEGIYTELQKSNFKLAKKSRISSLLSL